MVNQQHEPTGELVMTWWMDESYLYFVNKNEAGWDDAYINEVIHTPPEKSQKVKKLTGEIIVKWWMDSLDGIDEYLLFSLDKGETWKDKVNDINETVRKWREKHIEDHAGQRSTASPESPRPGRGAGPVFQGGADYPAGRIGGV